MRGCTYARMGRNRGRHWAVLMARNGHFYCPPMGSFPWPPTRGPGPPRRLHGRNGSRQRRPGPAVGSSSVRIAGSARWPRRTCPGHRPAPGRTEHLGPHHHRCAARERPGPAVTGGNGPSSPARRRTARRDGEGDHHPPAPVGQVDGIDDAVIGQVEDRARSITLRTSTLVHRLVVL